MDTLASCRETKMEKWRTALSLAAALTLSACASAPSPTQGDPQRTAIILGTVGQSEWCPAGNVRIDLETGDYVLTARAPRAVCQNPIWSDRSSNGGWMPPGITLLTGRSGARPRMD